MIDFANVARQLVMFLVCWTLYIFVFSIGMAAGLRVYLFEIPDFDKIVLIALFVAVAAGSVISGLNMTWIKWVAFIAYTAIVGVGFWFLVAAPASC